MTSKEIRREIRELKSEMKANHIKRMGFMNGGHTPESYRCNSRLYQLSIWLENALKEEAEVSA